MWRLQSEHGLREYVEYLHIQREEVLREFQIAPPQDLLVWQIRYNTIEEMIDFITKRPVEHNTR